jgi:ABC-type glutathione transport system ATPase component
MSDRILHLQNGNIMTLDEADTVYQQIRDHQTQKTS